MRRITKMRKSRWSFMGCLAVAMALSRLAGQPAAADENVPPIVIQDVQASHTTAGNGSHSGHGSCNAGTGCATACNDDCHGHRFYVRAEALWLNRTNFHRQSLSILDQPGINDDQILLDSRDVKFDFEPGLLLTLGYVLNDCWAVEGVYFGLQDHDEGASAPPQPSGVGVFGNLQPYWANAGLNDSGIGNLGALFQALGNATLGFTNSFQHSVSYASELHNAEINLRRASSPRASLIFGVRYMNLDEQFDFVSVDEDPAIDGDTGGGRYTVQTQNHLIGLQVGGDISRPFAQDRLWLTAHGKAAVMANFADQSSRFFSDTTNNAASATPLDISAEADDVQIATVVEVGLSGSYRITERISVRAGYTVWMLGGVALATQNLAEFPYAPGALAVINTSGFVVYHGPSVGVGVNW